MRRDREVVSSRHCEEHSCPPKPAFGRRRMRRSNPFFSFCCADGLLRFARNDGERLRPPYVVIARSTPVRRSPPSGEGGCDEAIHSFLFAAPMDCFASLAMTGRDCDHLTSSLRGALLSAEARLRAKADATRQSILFFLLRRWIAS